MVWWYGVVVWYVQHGQILGRVMSVPAGAFFVVEKVTPFSDLDICQCIFVRILLEVDQKVTQKVTNHKTLGLAQSTLS